MSAKLPLILFAKAPIAGKVKTRLTSHCNDQQAADLASILMQTSIEKAIKVWPGEVILSAAIDINHAFFKQMQQQYPITMVRQSEGHLGEKMRNALHEYGYPAAVMGCDAPHVSAASLLEAHQLMSKGQPVIGPAEDGGYYLLGLLESADKIFEDKAWGSNQILEATLKAAQSISLQFHHLEPLNDVDEWSDLISAAELVPSLKKYLVENDLI